jgi:DNA-binding LacI/PurR family transcriptional regulator
MVAAAVEMAITRTQQEDGDRTAVFTPQLIVRGSTGAAPDPHRR